MSLEELPKPREVADFEHLLMTSLERFVNASKDIGEPLSFLADKVVEAFQKNRDLIQYGLNNEEPEPDSSILEFYFETVKEIVDMKETYADDPYCNHFSTVSSAIVGLGWITCKTAPNQFVRDMREAGEYFSNRVLLRNRGDELHVNWVNRWNQLLTDLQQYVNSNFITGFTWGSEMRRRSAPPPPPLPEFPEAGGEGRHVDDARHDEQDRRALLQALNQGADITRRLRPVNRDANRPSTAPAGAARPAPRMPVERPSTAPAAAPAVAPAPRVQYGRPVYALHPPKLVLEGRKWVVEYQKNAMALEIDPDDMSQTLSMYKCEDSGLRVVEKMNQVVIDSCKRTCVVLNDIISAVELIRCERVKIQLDGTVPLINLDSCDSVQIFLTVNSRDVEIISSKSNSCNICLLEDDGDYKELAMPEQIRTVVDGERLVSTALERN